MDSYGFNKGELWQEISRRKQRAKIFIPLSPFLRGCPHLAESLEGGANSIQLLPLLGSGKPFLLKSLWPKDGN